MVQVACQRADAQPSTIDRARLLAPLWHTQTLVALMLAVAVTGTVRGTEAQAIAAAPASWSAYVPLMIVNAGLSLYVVRVGLPRSIFGALFSQGSYDKRRLLGDLASAGVLAVLLLTAENGFQALLGVPASTAAHALLPATFGARLAWFWVAALVGLSEELVYRGYLQRQLGAMSGQVPFGIVVQAMLFGIAHGEQGPWAVARFALYAVVLGWVTTARRSLLPSVMCHIAIDWYAALSV
jgi:uncharacterized protein